VPMKPESNRSTLHLRSMHMMKILTFTISLLPISSFSPLLLRRRHSCNRQSDDTNANRNALASWNGFSNCMSLRHAENESSVKMSSVLAPRQRKWFSSLQSSLSSSSCAEDANWYYVPTFSTSNADLDANCGGESRPPRRCDAVITSWSTITDKNNNNDSNSNCNESNQNDYNIRYQSHRWNRHMAKNHAGDFETKQQNRQHDNRYLHDSDIKENNNEGGNGYLKQVTTSPPPKEALEAIEATHRWASNFVRPLRLCPWAGSSLDTPGAMRYWVVVLDSNVDNSDNELNAVEVQWQRIIEGTVREAGRHLQQITSFSERNVDDEVVIDPSVAIAFVIIISRKKSSSILSLSSLQLMERSSPQEMRLSFDSFHEFFLDLEDRLLDECDVYWDDAEESSADDGGFDGCDSNTDDTAIDAPIGCEITIAAFHPQWQFSAPECDDGCNDSENDGIVREGTISTAPTAPIDFEKRTPFPTISIVMSSAIDALTKDRDQQQKQQNLNKTDSNSNGGDIQLIAAKNYSNSVQITEKIAHMNENTLNTIGTEKLMYLFDKDVMKCPSTVKKMDRIDPEKDLSSGM